MKTKHTSRSLAIVLVGVLMLALLSLGATSRAAALVGGKLPEKLSADDKMMRLNGLDPREKSMSKVYVGGLYLASPSKDAGAIFAADQAKAIRLHFLGDLTKKQLVGCFSGRLRGERPGQGWTEGDFRQVARAGSRRERG